MFETFVELIHELDKHQEQITWNTAAKKHERQDFGNYTLDKPRKRILLLGHANHGKDTAAEIIERLYGYKFESSSMAAARIFLFDALKGQYGYKTIQECYDDRVTKRKDWHDLIWAYNQNDPSKLAREILSTSNIYVGMRNDIEFNACRENGLFDLVLSVYDPRKPLESYDSFKIDMWGASHAVISNSTTKEDLEGRIKKMSPLFNY